MEDAPLSQSLRVSEVLFGYGGVAVALGRQLVTSRIPIVDPRPRHLAFPDFGAGMPRYVALAADRDRGIEIVDLG